jgi:hypothetical protein
MFNNYNYLRTDLYSMFNNLFFPKPKSDSIIEPLTCLIRLSILEFKQIGTKISIYENRITYNNPNMFQGALRWSNGDNREDIHNIYNSLIKATEWFDISESEIKNIFLCAIKGLQKLKLSYDENSIISHSISHYIQLLQHKVNGETTNSVVRTTRTRNNDSRDASNSSNSSNASNASDSSDSIDANENTIFLKLKELWNDREINIINNILLELEDNRKKSHYELKQDSLIDAIEIILLRKEDDLTNILKKTTTLLKNV